METKMCNNKSSFVGKYMATKKLRLQICFAFEALSGSYSCVIYFYVLSVLSLAYTRIHTLVRKFALSLSFPPCAMSL